MELVLGFLKVFCGEATGVCIKNETRYEYEGSDMNRRPVQIEVQYFFVNGKRLRKELPGRFEVSDGDEVCVVGRTHGSNIEPWAFRNLTTGSGTPTPSLIKAVAFWVGLPLAAWLVLGGILGYLFWWVDGKSFAWVGSYSLTGIPFVLFVAPIACWFAWSDWHAHRKLERFLRRREKNQGSAF